VIILPRLQAEQPHQMQAVGVIWIRGERLPAAKLRLEMPPRLHMQKAGLIERGWGEGGACRMLDRLASVHGGSSIQVAMGEQ